MRAMQYSPELTAMVLRFSTMKREFLKETGMVFLNLSR
jgi:hypothetical protein